MLANEARDTFECKRKGNVFLEEAEWILLLAKSSAP